jgi:hypothetical protein
LAWDGSNIEVEGVCTGDSIVYWLRNRGQGAMSSSRNYFITEDHIMLRTGNFQLPAGDSLRIVVPTSNTATIYRIQAQQHPQHPYRQATAAGLVNCLIPTGLSSNSGIALYPEDDASPSRSIDCQPAQNNNNNKQASPIGYSTPHFIEPGVDLEYQLRVQNKDSFSLYQITFIDTLSDELNISSLVMGASSHPYTWSLSGTGILTVNLTGQVAPSDWAFVKFRIAQKDSLPNGTLIYNSASISLNGRQLKQTNTTFHTVDDQFILSDQRLFPALQQLHVYPNPFSNAVTFELESEQSQAFEVVVVDAVGRLVGQLQSPSGGAVQWQRNHLPAGVYFYQLRIAGALVGTGKLVAAPQ